MTDRIETDHVVFKPSPIHGIGGFARHPVKPGTPIVEYQGRLLSKAESLEQCAAGNVFLIGLDDRHDLDGSVPWNPARFLNHSCTPNSRIECVRGRVWIVALRDIPAGEEITFDYGYDLEDYRHHPCRCGTPDCCGYIVAEALRSAVPQPRLRVPPSRGSDERR
ncbi:MAG: SET domain-containing protein-lysine N-methyltransferase [Verrucomicrobia bacterium]|nr:SET domain-containing protein-lysine N-methyltransferase [Verrucomicrobiota bacterium]